MLPDIRSIVIPSDGDCKPNRTNNAAGSLNCLSAGTRRIGHAEYIKAFQFEPWYRGTADSDVKTLTALA